MDIIISWIAENYPVLFLAIILIAIGGFATYFFCRYHFRIKRCTNDIKSINDKFDILHGLKEDITIIKSFLISTQPGTASLFSMKNSPRQLNENGEMLFSILNGEKFLSENLAVLLDKLKPRVFLTALDVEMGAKEVLFESMEEPFFSPVKKTIYNYPSIEVKMDDGSQKQYEFTLNDAVFILGIKLRNIYLELHPEITKE